MGDEYTNEQLCRLISAGQTWAKDRLISQNRGFVIKCADEIHKAHKAAFALSETDVDDLEQEELIALLAAAENFDPSRGTLFLTYAAPTIRNAMMDWLRENAKRFEFKYLRANPDLRWTEYDVEAEETSWRRIGMPNDPYTMTPEQIYLQRETGEALEAGLEKCGLRGRAYLMYRFGFDDGQEHSEAETARHYHLKRSWARRLEEDSLDILKSHLIAYGEYHGDTKKELTEAV